MTTQSMLMKSADVAALLSMERKTFYHFLKTEAGKTFPLPLKLSYRMYRWKRDEVEAWVNGRSKTNV